MGKRLVTRLLSRFSAVRRVNDWRGARLVMELAFSERILRFIRDARGEKLMMPGFSAQFNSRRFDKGKSGERSVIALPRNDRLVNCWKFWMSDKLVKPLPLR